MDKLTEQPGAHLTLDEAHKRWGRIADVNLYNGVNEQDQERHAGYYRLGRRGVTDADLLSFLSETEHLPTWERLREGRPDGRLAPSSRTALEKGRLSPFSCAEFLALSIRDGDDASTNDLLFAFRDGQSDRAEALERKARAAASAVVAPEKPSKSPKTKKAEKTPPKPAAGESKGSFPRDKSLSIIQAALSGDKIRPTEEQTQAIAAFGEGGSLKIIAGAGTGKTSTLKMIGESTSRRGVYIAFNTAMADDAKRRMPQNVTASTAHSLAFRHVDDGFRSKVSSRLPAGMAAEACGIRAMLELPGKGKDGEQLVISQAAAGYFMLDWVRHHCMSADAQITTANAPAGRMLDIMGIEREAATPGEWKQARDVAGALLPATHKLWARMSNPRDAFPASHDTYLKVWALSNPKIAADFILFDEAQDANALMLQIVGNQSAQKIYVGDPNQQIYAWRGAVNAMQSIQTDHEARLTESFRFGPEIAEFANHALGLCGSDLRITGKATAGRDLAQHRKPQVATLCRTNASVVRELMLAPDLSRTHVAGGVSRIVGLLNGMRELRDHDRTGNPELCHFKGWQELVMHAGSEADDLAALFKLTEDGDRIEQLTGMLEKTARVARPDSHVVSTAHKCKGLEWADVRLAGDFRAPGHKRWSVEEANLLYVAGTRGMRSLSLDAALVDGLGCKSNYREVDAPRSAELEQRSERESKQPPEPKVNRPHAAGRSGSARGFGRISWPFP